MNEQQLKTIIDVLAKGSHSRTPKEMLPGGLEPDRFRRANQWADPLTRNPAITAIGKGREVRNGEEVVFLKVYVEGLTEDSTNADFGIPDELSVPEWGSVEIRLVTGGRVRKQSGIGVSSFVACGKPAILHPGLCIDGWPDSTGTFGCVVKESKVGKLSLIRYFLDRDYILSNSHVLANDGVFDGPMDTRKVIQPAASLNPDEDIVGHLSKYVKFDFTPGFALNEVDAAIAVIKLGLPLSYNISELGQPLSKPVEPEEDMQVRKFGAASGLTCGRVTDTDLAAFAMEVLNPDYEQDGNYLKDAWFSNQFAVRLETCPEQSIPDVTQFSFQGDSGSIVVDAENRPVGLIMGAMLDSNEQYLFTICNRVSIVLDELLVVLPPPPTFLQVTLQALRRLLLKLGIRINAKT